MAGHLRGWVAVVCVAAGLVGAHGCSGKKRDFRHAVVGDSGLAEQEPAREVEPLLPGAAGAAGSGSSEEAPADVELPAAAVLGSSCAIDSGCDSGHCVAGRCCDSTCDSVCEVCSEAGLCNTVPADDQRCPVIPCSVATSCAEFPEQQVSERCGGLGICKTSCDPSTVAVDTVCGEAADGIERVCGEEGNCVDPRAAFGAACQSDRDCAEGSCVDGVCCREACGSACESCDATGSCVADEGQASCGDGLTCFGRGRCLTPDGGECDAGADCGSGNCEPAVGGGSACCPQPCGDGLFCNGDGECVSPESDLGNACTNDAQCVGGRCFDGVCCDAECGGACERCNAPGQAGRCSAAPAGTRDTCTAGLECAGRGQCLRPLGAVCTLNGECRSGECGAALQGSGEICCEAPCPNGQRCAANGSCVQAPLPDGATCTGNANCSSNSCVNGRCCESACGGVCQACSGLGDCNLSPGNDTRCPTVDCPTSNTVCVSYPADVTSNLCAAFGTCRTAQQECRPRFAGVGVACENVAPGVRGQCDGAGNCNDPRVGLSVPCTAGSQCMSGNCGPRAGGGDNLCCDSACTGVCEACGANGVCGFRDNGRCPLGQQCGSSRTTCEASCANGAACGSGPSQCSAQDTCNAQGQCSPNHLPAETRCGTLPSTCANPDRCDGAGTCQNRASQRIERCDRVDNDCDGATDEDFNLSSDSNNCGACGRSCQGGTCVGSVCQPFALVSGRANLSEIIVDGSNVYWLEANTVNRFPKSPTAGAQVITAASNQPMVNSLRRSANTNRLYWATGTQIVQANADGSAATPLVANRAGQILGMFLVQDSIYWSQRTTGADAEFFRSPVVGVAPVVLSGDSANPVLVGASGDCVFVTDDQGPLLWRLCARGDVSVPFQGIVRGFHADGSDLYVSAQGQGLFRLATPNNQNLASGNAMGDIEADNASLYFADGNGVTGNCTTSGSLSRIPKTGGTTQSIATNQSCIGQLAVDNDAVYWVDSVARQIMKVIKPL